MATVHLAASINNSHKHGLDYYAFYNESRKHIYKSEDSAICIDNIIGLGIDF